MKLCWKVIAATQFTVFMTLANVGRSVGSGLVGTLEKILPWEYVLLSSALLPVLMIVGMHFINFKKNETAILRIKIE